MYYYCQHPSRVRNSTLFISHDGKRGLQARTTKLAKSIIIHDGAFLRLWISGGHYASSGANTQQKDVVQRKNRACPITKSPRFAPLSADNVRPSRNRRVRSSFPGRKKRNSPGHQGRGKPKPIPIFANWSFDPESLFWVHESAYVPGRR